MNETGRDQSILLELAKQYAEIAAMPIMDERRNLWRDHYSLKETKTPVLILYGIWNAWCQEAFADEKLQCTDPFYRDYERWFRIQMHHAEVGDDFICEPWVPLRATYAVQGIDENDYRPLCTQSVYAQPTLSLSEAWGIKNVVRHGVTHGGAWKSEAPIKTWDDLELLKAPDHLINETVTQERLNLLHEAVGDVLEIDVQRGPILSGFGGDISTALGELRGIEQIMFDMYESPDRLHEMLAILRDGIINNQNQAEEAGDFSITCEPQQNQGFPYVDKLEDQKPNSGPRKKKDTWGFMAAQEFTLISPDFHDEFLLQYQLPIIRDYGVSHYGCCEDFTQKIDILRNIPTLRSIAVTPSADVVKCAKEIGADYAISWRPSPADMICAKWDDDRIRKLLKHGLTACQGTHFHICLKDVETLQGEPDRLKRWIEIVRSVIG
jgi:hypothetical protein